MHSGKLIISAICLALPLTGCEFSSISSATPDTGETVLLEPGDAQTFSVTTQIGEYDCNQWWAISNKNATDTQYDENNNLNAPFAHTTQYTADEESPGVYQVCFTIKDYMAIEHSGIVIQLGKKTKTWNVIVKGIDVLPEKNVSVLPGESQTYEAAAYPSGTYAYTWFLDDVQVSTGDQYVFAPTSAQCGLHTLKVNAAGEGGSFTYSRQLIVPFAIAEIDTYDSDLADFYPCADGGYVIAGTAANGAVTGLCGFGGYDGYIYKLGDQGQVVWRTLTGGDGGEGLYSVVPTLDGGSIAAGETGSTVFEDTTNTTGSGNAYIVRLDSDGKILWQKLFTASGSQWGECIKTIRQTSDGGFIAVGFDSASYNTHAVWVLKLDASGAVEWELSIGDPNGNYLYATVACTGDYLLAGTIDGYQGFVAKLNQSDGATIWQIFSDKVQMFKDITPTADGGCVVTGITAAGSSYAARLDQDGAVVWENIYAHETGALSVGTLLQNNANAGYVTAGSLCGLAMIMTLDEAGLVMKRLEFGEKGHSHYHVLAQPMTDGRYMAFVTDSITIFPDLFATDQTIYRTRYLVPVDVNTD